jgi:glucokinase
MADLFAGVDLGGTTISCGLASTDGRVVCEQEVATDSHEGPSAVLSRIATAMENLIAESGQRPRALGMGCPGLVDVKQGVVRFLPNLPTQWRGVPAAAILSEKLGCIVRLLNDVRTATLGELRFGHGELNGTMVFFSLGTGIGGGVAIDGRLRLGPLGAAGELGHQTIVPDGPLCGCGNHGCLEAIASGPAIVAEGVRLMKTGLAPQLYRRVDGDAGRITPKEIAAAAADGDEAVCDSIARAADYLGIGVANVVTILHPDLVVLGGGVAEMGDILVERVRNTMHKRVRMFPTDSIRVERSLLGQKAGLLGAVALAAFGVDGNP